MTRLTKEQERMVDHLIKSFEVTAPFHDREYINAVINQLLDMLGVHNAYIDLGAMTKTQTDPDLRGHFFLQDKSSAILKIHREGCGNEKQHRFHYPTYIG